MNVFRFRESSFLFFFFLREGERSLRGRVLNWGNEGFEGCSKRGKHGRTGRRPPPEGRWVNEGNIWRVLRKTSPTILVERASLLYPRVADSKRGIFSQEDWKEVADHLEGNLFVSPWKNRVKTDGNKFDRDQGREKKRKETRKEKGTGIFDLTGEKIREKRRYKKIRLFQE